MSLNLRNHKCSSSNPSLHIQKLSQELGSSEFITPKTAKGSRNILTQRGNRLELLTPKDDRKLYNFSSLCFPWEKSTPKLPRDIRSLDNYVQSNNYRLPPDREDAKQLLKWIDEMLSQTLEEQNEPEKVFESAYKIYNLCLAEVVKQVSVQCKERGALLERVWKAYQTLFEKAIKMQDMKKELSEERHSNEKNRIHKLYNSQIKDLEDNILNLEKKKWKYFNRTTR